MTGKIKDPPILGNVISHKGYSEVQWGEHTTITTTLVLFFVLFLSYFTFKDRLVNGPVRVTSGHAPCARRGAFCPAAFACSPTSSHQLVGLLILSGTARRNRRHAHCLFIPCFNFHYYVSQKMHALANSYWHKKLFEFLPALGETE